MKLNAKSFVTFAEFVGHTVLRFFSGKKVFVSEARQEERIFVCEQCVYFDEEHRQCRVCSCFMDLKVRFEDVKCPCNFW